MLPITAAPLKLNFAQLALVQHTHWGPLDDDYTTS